MLKYHIYLRMTTIYHGLFLTFSDCHVWACEEMINICLHGSKIKSMCVFSFWKENFRKYWYGACDVQKKNDFLLYLDVLWRYFSRYGELSDAVVIMDRQTGRSRGFGFVTFRDPQCVDEVLHEGQHTIDGRQVNV